MTLMQNTKNTQKSNFQKNDYAMTSKPKTQKILAENVMFFPWPCCERNVWPVNEGNEKYLMLNYSALYLKNKKQ